MKFYFFHLMPYGDIDFAAIDSHPSAWVNLPNENFDPRKGHALYNRYLDELELADKLGFDGVCVNEHHQTAYGLMPAPNVLAGALARSTENAKICVLGRALPLLDNPLAVAEEFAMLDNLTAGRLIAGFVRGIGCEYHVSNANPGFSNERFREAHDLILRAWTEPGPFAFEGKHYHFQYANIWPVPFQKPHPDIWIPSQGSRETAEWAAHPDRKYTYLLTYSPVELVKSNMDQYREFVAGFGYEFSPDKLGWALPTYVAETDEIARRESAAHIESLFNKYMKMPMEYVMPPGYSSMASMKRAIERKYKVRGQYMPIDLLIEQGMFICGGPATVRELLARREEELGFGRFVPMMQFGTLPHELTVKNLHIFAEEIMPAFRDKAGAAVLN